MELAFYFEGEQIDRALRHYQTFIQREKSKWQLGQEDDKLDLYRWADVAFGPSRDENLREENFKRIYKVLRGWWGVFRTSRPLGHWKCDQVFDAMQAHEERCGRSSKLTLLDIDQVERQRAVIHCLQKMRGLKTLVDGRTPIMAISKFLHFFNPRLFPIWDTAVIQTQVLKTFDSDWIIPDWTGDADVDQPIREYLGYLLLANQVMRQEPQVVMRKFVDWVARQANVEGDSSALPPGLHEYYSTAFEFIAIGASQIQAGDSLSRHH